MSKKHGEISIIGWIQYGASPLTTTKTRAVSGGWSGEEKVFLELVWPQEEFEMSTEVRRFLEGDDLADVW